MTTSTPTKQAWTPGPWEADHCTEPSPNPGYFQIDAPLPAGLRTYAPYTVADTMNRDFRISPEEDAANAKLIAKAPEMAAKLEAALPFLNRFALHTVEKFGTAMELATLIAEIECVLKEAGAL